MSDWKALREQILSNSEVSEEYERLRPQFELASELIELRKSLGLTQRDLAAIAGMTQPEIARIESGRVAPRWDKIVNLLWSVGASVQIVPPPRQKRLRLAPVGAGSGARRAAATGRYARNQKRADTGRYGRHGRHGKIASAEGSLTVKGGNSAMAKPNVHTTPRETGEWANIREGATRASSVHRTKQDAVSAGRTQAKNAGVEHVIHNKDGKIAERNSYGNDPYPPKG